MKTIATLIFAIIFSSTLFSQNPETTLVKSFNLQGINEMICKLEGKVEIKKWNNSTARVLIKVSVGNSSKSMLKSLVQSKRYSLKSKKEENKLVVFAPKLDKEIRIGDQKIEEIISYTIFIPENISIDSNVDSPISALK